MQSIKLCTCISSTVKLPEPPTSSWSEQQKQINETNARTVNLLYYALSPVEFVSTPNGAS